MSLTLWKTVGCCYMRNNARIMLLKIRVQTLLLSIVGKIPFCCIGECCSYCILQVHIGYSCIDIFKQIIPPCGGTLLCFSSPRQAKQVVPSASFKPEFQSAFPQNIIFYLF